MQCKAYCAHIVHHSRKSVVYCQSLMSCKHNCLTLSTSHDSHSTSSADAGKCETSISWSPTGEYMYPSALSSINNTRVPVGSGYNLLTPAGKENERGSDYNPQWHAHAPCVDGTHLQHVGIHWPPASQPGRNNISYQTNKEKEKKKGKKKLWQKYFMKQKKWNSKNVSKMRTKKKGTCNIERKGEKKKYMYYRQGNSWIE